MLPSSPLPQTASTPSRPHLDPAWKEGRLIYLRMVFQCQSIVSVPYPTRQHWQVHFVADSHLCNETNPNLHLNHHSRLSWFRQERGLNPCWKKLNVDFCRTNTSISIYPYTTMKIMRGCALSALKALLSPGHHTSSRAS